jgi:diadenosine tetraphosphatase ApaH/serine/threonine PP2A family protein phosphatase
MDGYVYPDSPIEEFLRYSPGCFFLGHTHYPMKRSIKEKYIVNPGSLGQARNGGWPTYAVVDYYSKEVSIKEVVYDKSGLLKQINEAGDNTRYLKDILEK